MQASLDRLLVRPVATAAAESLQGYLKLLTEAFKRTLALADSLQQVAGQAVNVADLANAAFSESLADYPDMELQWLRLLHQSKASQVSLSCPANLGIHDHMLGRVHSSHTHIHTATFHVG